MDASNRRRRTRVNFRTKVDVQTTGARLVDVESRDLSHKGLYLVGDLPLKAGQGCTLTVHLVGEDENAPVLHMEGRIIRADRQGTAIDFVSMDAETYMHLRNLVIFNAPDPEAAEQEFATPAFEITGE
ncbi:MAG: PilZ domain-containing protein [Desulfarculus sp.]|nr:PilZ domain-containing protein [Desulfarculus sp.]